MTSRERRAIRLLARSGEDIRLLARTARRLIANGLVRAVEVSRAEDEPLTYCHRLTQAGRERAIRL